jgi:hypothetical protein
MQLALCSCHSSGAWQIATDLGGHGADLRVLKALPGRPEQWGGETAASLQWTSQAGRAAIWVYG